MLSNIFLCFFGLGGSVGPEITDLGRPRCGLALAGLDLCVEIFQFFKARTRNMLKQTGPLVRSGIEGYKGDGGLCGGSYLVVGGDQLGLGCSCFGGLSF